MEQRVPHQQHPWWVKLARTGARGRRTQLLYLAFSIAAGIGLLIYGTRDLRFGIVGVGFLASAFLNWMTIRWMDRHWS